ncbi:MAG: hypothetical protein Q7S21_04265 [archaeon]|nr:hypothetical protein [archaeon]
MSQKVSRKEIDGMIDVLISAISKGKLLTVQEKKKFIQVYHTSMSEKGIDTSYGGTRLKAFGNPQGYLLELFDAGIVTAQRHKKFIAKYKPLIDLEFSLLGLAHLEPPTSKFFGIVFGMYQHPTNDEGGRPIEERINYFNQIIGNRKDLENLMQLCLKANSSKIPDGPEKDRLIVEYKKAFNEVSTRLKNQLSLKLGKEMPIVSLRKALSNPHLSSKEKTIIARYIERLEGGSGKKFQLDKVSFLKRRKRIVRK